MVDNIIRIGTFILLALTWVSGVTIVKGVTLTKAVGIIVAIMWLFYKLGEWGITNKKEKMAKKNGILILFIILFLFIGLLSFFWASNIDLFFRNLKTLVMSLIMIIIFHEQFQTKRDFELAYKVLTYSGVIASLFIVLQYFGGFYFSNVSTYNVIKVNNTVRATGFFSEPNYAALQMVVVFSLVFYLIIISRNKIRKLLLFIGLLITVMSIIVTLSRAAILSLIVTLMLTIGFSRYRGRLIAIVGLILTVLFLFLPMEDILIRFNTIFDFFVNINNLDYLANHYGSLWKRYNLLISGVYMFINNFFTGVGLGSFQFKSLKYGAISAQVAHNTYLSIAGELGFFGIMIFLIIIFLTWRNFNLAENRFQSKNLLFLTKGLKVGFLSFLFGSFFLTAQYEKIFWVLISFSMISFSNASNKKHKL